MQALAYLGQGQRVTARAAIGLALELAAAEVYMRVFVDEGAPMVALLHMAREAGIMST